MAQKQQQLSWLDLINSIIYAKNLIFAPYSIAQLCLDFIYLVVSMSMTKKGAKKREKRYCMSCMN